MSATKSSTDAKGASDWSDPDDLAQPPPPHIVLQDHKQQPGAAADRAKTSKQSGGRDAHGAAIPAHHTERLPGTAGGVKASQGRVISAHSASSVSDSAHSSVSRSASRHTDSDASSCSDGSSSNVAEEDLAEALALWHQKSASGFKPEQANVDRHPAQKPRTEPAEVPPLPQSRAAPPPPPTPPPRSARSAAAATAASGAVSPGGAPAPPRIPTTRGTPKGVKVPLPSPQSTLDGAHGAHEPLLTSQMMNTSASNGSSSLGTTTVSTSQVQEEEIAAAVALWELKKATSAPAAAAAAAAVGVVPASAKTAHAAGDGNKKEKGEVAASSSHHSPHSDGGKGGAVSLGGTSTTAPNAAPPYRRERSIPTLQDLYGARAKPTPSDRHTDPAAASVRGVENTFAAPAISPRKAPTPPTAATTSRANTQPAASSAPPPTRNQPQPSPAPAYPPVVRISQLVSPSSPSSGGFTPAGPTPPLRFSKATTTTAAAAATRQAHAAVPSASRSPPPLPHRWREKAPNEPNAAVGAVNGARVSTTASPTPYQAQYALHFPPSTTGMQNVDLDVKESLPHTAKPSQEASTTPSAPPTTALNWTVGNGSTVEAAMFSPMSDTDVNDMYAGSTTLAGAALVAGDEPTTPCITVPVSREGSGVTLQAIQQRETVFDAEVQRINETFYHAGHQIVVRDELIEKLQRELNELREQFLIAVPLEQQQHQPQQQHAALCETRSQLFDRMDAIAADLEQERRKSREAVDEVRALRKAARAHEKRAAQLSNVNDELLRQLQVSDTALRDAAHEYRKQHSKARRGFRDQLQELDREFRDLESRFLLTQEERNGLEKNCGEREAKLLQLEAAFAQQRANEQKRFKELWLERDQLREEVTVVRLSMARLLQVLSEVPDLKGYLRWNESDSEFVFLGYPTRYFGNVCGGGGGGTGEDNRGEEGRGERNRASSLTTATTAAPAAAGTSSAARRRAQRAGSPTSWFTAPSPNTEPLLMSSDIIREDLSREPSPRARGATGVEDGVYGGTTSAMQSKNIWLNGRWITRLQEILAGENQFTRLRHIKLLEMEEAAQVTELLPTARDVLECRRQEKDFWVPYAVFSEAQKFKNRYYPKLPALDVFYPFLMRLNAVWNAKMQDRLRVMKKDLQNSQQHLVSVKRTPPFRPYASASSQPSRSLSPTTVGLGSRDPTMFSPLNQYDSSGLLSSHALSGNGLDASLRSQRRQRRLVLTGLAHDNAELRAEHARLRREVRMRVTSRGSLQLFRLYDGLCHQLCGCLSRVLNTCNELEDVTLDQYLSSRSPTVGNSYGEEPEAMKAENGLNGSVLGEDDEAVQDGLHSASNEHRPRKGHRSAHHRQQRTHNYLHATASSRNRSTQQETQEHMRSVGSSTKEGASIHDLRSPSSPSPRRQGRNHGSLQSSGKQGQHQELNRSRRHADPGTTVASALGLSTSTAHGKAVVSQRVAEEASIERLLCLVQHTCERACAVADALAYHTDACCADMEQFISPLRSRLAVTRNTSMSSHPELGESGSSVQSNLQQQIRDILNSQYAMPPSAKSTEEGEWNASAGRASAGLDPRAMGQVLESVLDFCGELRGEVNRAQEALRALSTQAMTEAVEC